MSIIQLYARLLRLYPQAFYARFGSEMLGVFEQSWADQKRTWPALLLFCLTEFTGLLLSIGLEHGRKRGFIMTQWRAVPFWLAGLCLLLASGFSLHYWGYLVQPSSTFAALQTVDSVVLVKFDAEYRPTLIPIRELPYVVSPDFPPSQILPLIQQKGGTNRLASALEPKLADQLTAVLTAEAIDLGYAPVELPTEPVRNLNGCGQCFQAGIQPQPDGSFLEITPKISVDGQLLDETQAHRVTPNEWWYYRYVRPAGYIVQGRGADGTPRVFMSLASNSIGGDRYRYYEYVFDVVDDALVVHDRMNYRFDIAGLEGLNFVLMTVLLWLPLLLMWLVVGIGGYMRQQVAGWGKFKSI